MSAKAKKVMDFSTVYEYHEMSMLREMYFSLFLSYESKQTNRGWNGDAYNVFVDEN